MRQIKLLALSLVLVSSVFSTQALTLENLRVVSAGIASAQLELEVDLASSEAAVGLGVVYSHDAFCYTNALSGALSGTISIALPTLKPNTAYRAFVAASREGVEVSRSQVVEFQTSRESSVVLPAGYHSVEYVYSDGRQWVDTEYSVGQANCDGLKIVCDTEISGEDGQWCVCGLGGGSPSVYFGSGPREVYAGQAYAYGNGASDQKTSVAHVNSRRIYQLTYASGTSASKYTVKDPKFGGMDVDVSFTMASVSGNATFPVFAWKNASHGGGHQFVQKIWSLKFYEGKDVEIKLKAEYLPVADDAGNGALYERIGGTLHPSETDVALLSGPESASAISVESVVYDGAALAAVLTRKTAEEASAVFCCSGPSYAAGGTNEWAHCEACDEGFDAGVQQAIVRVAALPEGDRYLRFYTDQGLIGETVFIPELEKRTAGIEIGQVTTETISKTTAKFTVPFLMKGTRPDALKLTASYGYGAQTWTVAVPVPPSEMAVDLELTHLRLGTAYTLTLEAENGVATERQKLAPIVFSTVLEDGSVGLPDGDKRLDYVESDGTQWVDTGYLVGPANALGLRLVCDTTIVKQNGMYDVCGIGGSTDLTFYFGVYNTGCYAFGRGSSDVETGVHFIDDTRQIYELKLEGDGASNVYSVREAATGNEIVNYRFGFEKFKVSSTYPVFAWTKPDHTGGQRLKQKIYDLQFFQRGEDGDVLTAKYIPVADGNGVACLYETIGGTYHYSETASPLLAGPEFAPDLAVAVGKKAGPKLDLTVTRKNTSPAQEVYVAFGKDYGGNDEANWDKNILVGTFAEGRSVLRVESPQLLKRHNYLRVHTADGTWAETIYIPDTPLRPIGTVIIFR